MHKLSKTMVAEGNLLQAVMLPQNEELNDWLAVHVVDFFNQISLLYGCVTELCTPQTCTVMSAGKSFEYLWSDGKSKPIKTSAPDYIDRLMTWIQDTLDDPTQFPDAGVEFPADFPSKVKIIFKKLFRVYAHMFHSHVEQLEKLGVLVHFTTCIKHFTLFAIQYDLIPSAELEPMHDLVEQIRALKVANETGSVQGPASVSSFSSIVSLSS